MPLIPVNIFLIPCNVVIFKALSHGQTNCEYISNILKICSKLAIGQSVELWFLI